MSTEKLTCDGASLTLHHRAPEMSPGLRTMAVSHLKCDAAASGAGVLAQAGDAARAAGAAALIGPMEGDTWHSYRLVSDSDGRAPFLMEPKSAPHDLDAFVQAGFSVIGRYVSAAAPLGPMASDAPEPVAAPDGLRVEEWDGRDAEALFTQVHALSCTAFAGNPYYLPIDLAAFLAMYMPLVPLLKPELILFARTGDDALAGFLFGIPNYAEGPSPGTAILKTYASLRKGAGHALSQRFHANARALGCDTVIHALMHEDNLSLARSGLEGADVFRRYALMGRRLDG
ncbi:hypothetical protein [Roseivivax sp. CAU 1753]